MTVPERVDQSAPFSAPPEGRPSETPGPAPHPWAVLGVIGLAQVMVVLDTTVVNIALPSAQADLGFSTANRQWVVTGYALAFGSLLLLGGRLSDMIGRRTTLLVGLLGIAEHRSNTNLLTRFAQRAAVFGRASFVTYVAQQWLIEFVPMWLGFDNWLTPRYVLIYLVLIVGVTYLLADAWDRRGGNRYLTLGIKWIFASGERAAAAEPHAIERVATRAS